MSVSDPGTPSLDQLRVFLTVIEEGSFAAAARRLGRATSAVAYQVDGLEAQLGLALFERESTRRPRLTAAGEALLAEARAVSLGVDALRARARGLLQGLESEVTLAVDVMLPSRRLVDAARAFQAAFPTVPLRLHVESLGAVSQLVLDRRAVLGLCGPIHGPDHDLVWIGAGEVELTPVAAPDHPLAGMESIAPGSAREHLQIVLSDRSPLTAGQDFGVLGGRTWRTADLSAKHALLLAGVGWGSLPRPVVERDLELGRLKALALPDWPARRYPFHLIHRIDNPPGPATRWLISCFAAQADQDAATPGRP